MLQLLSTRFPPNLKKLPEQQYYTVPECTKYNKLTTSHLFTPFIQTASRKQQFTVDIPGLEGAFWSGSTCISEFALGFIFLLPPFSPIRFFFLCHFLKLRPSFFAIFRKKKSQVFGHSSQKKSSVNNPLNSGGLFYTHWYNNYGMVHFVFKAVDSL